MIFRRAIGNADYPNYSSVKVGTTQSTRLTAGKIMACHIPEKTYFCFAIERSSSFDPVTTAGLYRTRTLDFQATQKSKAQASFKLGLIDSSRRPISTRAFVVKIGRSRIRLHSTLDKCLYFQDIAVKHWNRQ